MPRGDVPNTDDKDANAPELDPSQRALRDFLAEAERLITPSYTECFSDEARNLLLITSFVLILLVLGTISVGSNAKAQIPPLALSITVNTGVRWMLLSICAYFLFLHTARSYVEWKLSRLRQIAPMAEYMAIRDKIGAPRGRRDSKNSTNPMSG